MLAAKLYGPGDVRLTECAVPEIGPGELLLKTAAAAICGSDLRMIANGYRGVDEAHPLTLGHELSGVIVESRAQGYEPGTPVSVAPNLGCGICDMCVAGDTHLCGDYQALGINLDGGFAEYVRIPAAAVAQGNVLPLAEAELETAALYEPMSCVFNGHERVGVHPGDTVLVIGAGPIGVMHGLLAAEEGASQILIRDLSQERVEQCVEAVPGATPLYREDLLAEVMNVTGQKGVDVCITACPSGAAQASSLELMATNGRVLFFGGLPAGKDAVTMATNLIHYRQLTICGSTRGNTAQYRAVARLAAAGRLRLDKLVTRRYGLPEFLEAVEYAKSAKGLKTVITFGERKG